MYYPLPSLTTECKPNSYVTSNRYLKVRLISKEGIHLHRKNPGGGKFLPTRNLLSGWSSVLWLRGVGAEILKELHPETLLFPREVVCIRKRENPGEL